jgi:hypothetical protein
MLAGEPVWPLIAEHNADLAERGGAGVALYPRRPALPRFEMDSAERFFARHFGGGERLS